MQYSKSGDTVRLEMAQEDYAQMLQMLGCAAGMAHRAGDTRTFYAWIDFVNRLNAGNPDFRPYEIPEKFQGTIGRTPAWRENLGNL